MSTFDELRARHPRFTYEDYTVERAGADLRFTFSFTMAPDIAFAPTTTLRAPQAASPPLSPLRRPRSARRIPVGSTPFRPRRCTGSRSTSDSSSS